MFLEVNKLNLFRNEKELIRNFSLKVNKGDRVGFFLPTGSGKSTLFDLINSGTDFIEGVKGTVQMEEGIVVGRVFQKPVFLENLSLLRNITIPLENYLSKKDAVFQAQKYLEMLNLSTKINDKAGTLSGGEKQRLCIARALAYKSDLLLFDEPFSFQDEENKNHIIQVLDSECKERNLTLLIISHNLKDLEYLCQNVVNNFIINYN